MRPTANDVRSRRLLLLLCSPSSPRGLSQQKIFEHELALSPRQRAAASVANYLARMRFGTGFDFDDVVEGLAVWTGEGIEGRRLTTHEALPSAYRIGLTL